MNFQKFQLKWKILKHFASLEQGHTWRKLLSSPFPSDKSFLRLWNKNFRMLIYGNTQTFAFQVLQECSSWASRNSAVQFFFDPNRKHVFGCVAAWPGGLSCCDQNRKVPDSNLTKCLTGLRDPTLLQGLPVTFGLTTKKRSD